MKIRDIKVSQLRRSRRKRCRQCGLGYNRKYWAPYSGVLPCRKNILNGPLYSRQINANERRGKRFDRKVSSNRIRTLFELFR